MADWDRFQRVRGKKLKAAVAAVCAELIGGSSSVNDLIDAFRAIVQASNGITTLEPFLRQLRRLAADSFGLFPEHNLKTALAAAEREVRAKTKPTNLMDQLLRSSVELSIVRGENNEETLVASYVRRVLDFCVIEAEDGVLHQRGAQQFLAEQERVKGIVSTAATFCAKELAKRPDAKRLSPARLKRDAPNMDTILS